MQGEAGEEVSREMTRRSREEGEEAGRGKEKQGRRPGAARRGRAAAHRAREVPKRLDGSDEGGGRWVQMVVHKICNARRRQRCNACP